MDIGGHGFWDMGVRPKNGIFQETKVSNVSSTGTNSNLSFAKN